MSCDGPYRGECCDTSCASPADLGQPVVAAFRLQLGPSGWTQPPPGQSDLRGYYAWAAPGGGQVNTDRNVGGFPAPDPNQTPGRAFLKPGRWLMTYTPTGFPSDPNIGFDLVIGWITRRYSTPTSSLEAFEPDRILVFTGSIFRDGLGNLTRPTPGPSVTRQLLVPCTTDGFYFVLAYGRARSDPPVPGTIVIDAQWLSDPP
jgi:hypothetical protein